MKIPPVEFRSGSSELWIQSRRDLTELASRLKSTPYYYLLIVGNARAEGDIEANKALALERAKSVYDYLTTDLGVSKNRVKAIAAEPSKKGAEAQSVTFAVKEPSY
jgi:outer membrane protein OmpA-like peptidoglycan-associated protein